ncbi:MAG: hypothetical protein WCA08_14650 [Desulfoferrobacter sp.]
MYRALPIHGPNRSDAPRGVTEGGEVEIAEMVLFSCPPCVKQSVVLERKGLSVGCMNPCIGIAE